MKRVFVVTCLVLGWDSLIGVFYPANVSCEQLLKHFPKSEGYIIYDRELQVDLMMFTEIADED